ncbi:MAG TPA: hypothetical protein VGJ21_13215, partial [Terracidiphilus sp.]
MISIRKFLDAPMPVEQSEPVPTRNGRAPEISPLSPLAAYQSVLAEIGHSCMEACPATGPDLEHSLQQAADALSDPKDEIAVAASDASVRRHLQDWGRRTARHYRQKAGEVKDILMAMAQTAEAVGDRDQRCAGRLHAVTAQLQQIANLDDITMMRKSIEERAAELRTSIERMTDEGHAVLQQLQDRVAIFQSKLEEAERAASLDSLTRLRSRTFVET